MLTILILSILSQRGHSGLPESHGIRVFRPVAVRLWLSDLAQRFRLGAIVVHARACERLLSPDHVLCRQSLVRRGTVASDTTVRVWRDRVCAHRPRAHCIVILELYTCTGHVQLDCIERRVVLERACARHRCRQFDWFAVDVVQVSSGRAVVTRRASADPKIRFRHLQPLVCWTFDQQREVATSFAVARGYFVLSRGV